jgi:hypothetical protein
MAFNPFHGFRKHKRVIFAILTIICMITFVLVGTGAGGKGDFFDWLLSMFGAGRKQGEVVMKLDGSKIYESQVSERVRLRNTANNFVRRSALGPGFLATMDKIVDYLQKTSPTEVEPLSSFRKAIADAYFEALLEMLARNDAINHAPLKDLFAREPALLQRFEMAQRNASLPLGRKLQNFDAERQKLINIRSILVTKNFDDEVAMLDGMLLRLNYELWEFAARSVDKKEDGQSLLVFGGSTQRQDVLDFMMWLKQADTLGIKFTDEDVRSVLSELAPCGVPNPDAKSNEKDTRPLTGNKVLDQKRLDASFNKELAVDLKTLYRALRDEFRVSVAQGIILGQEPGLMASRPSVFRPPLGITPVEYLDYYRDQLAKSNVVLLQVPVASFLPSEPKPTERQLEELFNSYKRRVPEPWSSLPGFRVPQRIRVQWISTQRLPKSAYQEVARLAPLAGFLRDYEDPREKHYQAPARAHLAQLLALAVASKTPYGVLQVADLTKAAYDSARADFEVPTLLQGDPALTFYSVPNRPEVIASTIAQAVGAGGSGQLSVPVNTLVTMLSSQAETVLLRTKSQEALAKQEVTKRARVVAGLVGSSMGPSFTKTPPWIWADDNGKELVDPPPRVLDRFVPLASVETQTLDLLVRIVGSILEREHFAELTKKLTDAKGDPVLAQAAIAEAVKKMGLESAIRESAFDFDEPATVNKDPGLRSLRDSYEFQKQLEELFGGSLPPGDSFVGRLFDQTGIYMPQHMMILSQGVARQVGIRAENVPLYWKTKNEPARTPTLADVREEVVRAWHMTEARRLARKKAEAISQEISGKSEKEAVKILEGLREKNDWGRLIRLDDLSKQKELPRLNPRESFSYDPVRIPEEDIAYPSDSFIPDLMKLKAEEAGVLKDRPEKTFYVAYVIKRTDAPPIATAVDKDHREYLWFQLDREQRERKRQAILDTLRRQASGGKLVAGRFELNPNLKSEESTRSDD